MWFGCTAPVYSGKWRGAKLISDSAVWKSKHGICGAAWEEGVTSAACHSRFIWKCCNDEKYQIVHTKMAMNSSMAQRSNCLKVKIQGVRSAAHMLFCSVMFGHRCKKKNFVLASFLDRCQNFAVTLNRDASSVCFHLFCFAGTSKADVLWLRSDSDNVKKEGIFFESHAPLTTAAFPTRLPNFNLLKYLHRWRQHSSWFWGHRAARARCSNHFFHHLAREQEFLILTLFLVGSVHSDPHRRGLAATSDNPCFPLTRTCRFLWGWTSSWSVLVQLEQSLDCPVCVLGRIS